MRKKKDKIAITFCFLLGLKFTNAASHHSCYSDLDWDQTHQIPSDPLAYPYSNPNDQRATYELPFKIHCNFTIRSENGTKVPEEDYKVTFNPGNSHDDITVDKHLEGKFTILFEDGFSKIFYLYYISDKEKVDSYNTTVYRTFEKNLANPTFEKEYVWNIPESSKFAHCIELKCMRANATSVILSSDSHENVSCVGPKTIKVSAKDSRLEDDNTLIWIKTCDYENHMWRENTRLILKLKVTDQDLDSIDTTRVFTQKVNMKKSITNLAPKDLSFKLSKVNEKFQKCINIHGCSILDETKDIQLTCLNNNIKLHFNQGVQQSRDVIIACHQDIAWSLKINLTLTDTATSSFVVLSLFGALVAVTAIGLCLAVKMKQTKKKMKIHDDSNLTDALNTKVVIPFDSDESQSKSTDGYASDNYMILQKEFGSLTNKVVLPWSSVEKGHLLGEGAYGKVYHGFLNMGQFTRVEVAIKEVSSKEGIKDHIHEAKTMARVIRHDHIVNLQGITCSGHNIYLLLEFCAHNSIQKYLEKSHAKYVQKAKESHDYDFIMRSCVQVASGMTFLAENGIKHVSVNQVNSQNSFHFFTFAFQCDLAARNVLVTHDLQVKIADFGLSERDYSDPTIAPAKSSAKFQPICWLAYEVHLYLSFHIRNLYLKHFQVLLSKAKEYESDVWSFGVFMWEVFEFGCGQPFVFLKDERGSIPCVRLIEYFEEGHRLPMPELCPSAIFDLMLQCWELEPSARPSFKALKKHLEILARKTHELERPRYDKLQKQQHYIHVLDIIQENQALLPQPPQFIVTQV